MTNSFNTLPLDSKLQTNLETLGFHSMTPIQEQALPLILKGHDLIAQAKTGSGKTAAFGLGILNKLNLANKTLQSLVLCPTHELAEQVAEEIRRLARNTANCKVLVICGGTSEFQQLNSLEHGVHIIVGTPGRVLKFLKKGAINLQLINFLVLDEADRMLDMGFREEMEAIATFAPRVKQALLFSATFPDEIEDLSRVFQKNPKRLSVDSKHEINVIKQIFIEVDEHRKKLEALNRLLGQYKPQSTIIFCKTKQLCADVAKALVKQGIAALAFHGDLDQNERTVVFTKFSNKSCLVLVATDVAARGLDVKDLEAVVNFDLPTDAEVYTHRIGRTARAGKIGLAFSFFVATEKHKLQDIEIYTGNKNEFLSIDSLNPTLKFDLKAPMKTMYINGGKKEKMRAGDILGALVNEAGIDPKDVGNINIFEKQSYVAIASSQIENAVARLLEGKIKGRRFKVGEA
ncbi:MAG: ATP-dependent RNA helicase DbpA [Bacteriovoracaceae bacterium]|nr:ATP-dependent RNA helicase DbpA [Bacteriovoracaceae bacterium]